MNSELKNMQAECYRTENQKHWLNKIPFSLPHWKPNLPIDLACIWTKKKKKKKMGAY